MDWKGKATIEESVIRPKPYLMITIKFNKPIDIENLKEHQDIEWIEEKRSPPMMRTILGSIRIQSKYCAQILHANNPKESEQIQKFIYDVIFNNEKRKLIEIIKEEWEAFEKWFE